MNRGLDRDRRSAWIVLILLVISDLAIFGLHLFATARASPNGLLYIDVDRSYGEFFQYIKFVWLIVLIGVCALDRRSWRIALWMPLFIYMLADDALSIHERVGRELVDTLGLTEALGLRAEDLGELIVFGVAGIVVIGPLLLAYLFADAGTRWIFRVLGALLVLLIVFGVVFDMLHIVVIDDPRPGDWMGFLEDGGEMLTVSLMVAFVAWLTVSAPHATSETEPVEST